MTLGIIDGRCNIPDKFGRVHCANCLAGKGILKEGETCPSPPGLGDKVEAWAKPIAKALGLGCLDKSGKLKPQSGCAKRRDMLNRALPNRRTVANVSAK